MTSRTPSQALRLVVGAAAVAAGLVRALGDLGAERGSPGAVARDNLVKVATKNTWISVAQGIQAVATIFALIVGGLWALTLYLQTREAYPKVVTEHHLEHVPLRNGSALVRAAITVSNEGSTRLIARSGNIRLQQIRPLAGCGGDPSVFCPKDKIASGINPVPEGQTTAPWPMLEFSEISPRGEDRPIEPGEPDTFYYDFVIPSDVEVVQLYSFIKNEAVDDDVLWREIIYYFTGSEPIKGGVGWKKITIHDLNGTDPGGNP